MRLLPAVLTLILVTTVCAVNLNDPGNCTKQKRGKFVVVKDRSHNDKVLVCVARHGKYQWDVINDHKMLRQEIKAESERKIKDVIGKLNSFKQEINRKLATVNGRSEKRINGVTRNLNSFKQEVYNKFAALNKAVKGPTYGSCKQIWKSKSNKGSGGYKINVGRNQFTTMYCRMSSVSACLGGGWTLVMKIDGSSSAFKYSSSYWTSKNSYCDNSYCRNGGLDNRQYKGSSYWRTSFKEICVGMKYGGRLRAFSFPYTASSLYSLIADGNYRRTHLGRSQWKWLIPGSSLQRNCNREGFNVYTHNRSYIRVRLGFIGNEQNNCASPDSFIGLGGEGGQYPHSWCGYSASANTAGNLGFCRAENGNKNAKAMGYILVR